MQPIPKSLLIHGALLHTLGPKDAWGDADSADTQLLNIRIDPFEKYLIDNTQHEVQASALLLFDCRHSRPTGTSFVEGQTVTFNGRTYEVQTVEPLYDRRRLHHVEVVLV